MILNRNQILPDGVVVPLITPRHLPEVFPLIDHIVAGGVSSLFIFGTTGEALTLDHTLKIGLIRQVAAHLRGRIPLLVGIASKNVSDAVELMRIAHEVGSPAAVVVPHMWGGNGVELVNTLLSSAPGNLMLYNNPALTGGLFFPIEQIRTLAGKERILGIKDSSGDLAYFGELLKVKKEHGDFKLYYGPEKKYSEVLHQEINGLVPSSANLEPHLAAELWRCKGNNLWTEWDALKTKVQEAVGGNYIERIKHLLKQQKLITDARMWS